MESSGLNSDENLPEGMVSLFDLGLFYSHEFIRRVFYLSI
jgi:hypothetical protein